MNKASGASHQPYSSSDIAVTVKHNDDEKSDGMIDFDLRKMKKKKHVSTGTEKATKTDKVRNDDIEQTEQRLPCDYPYEGLLDRIYSNIRECNPELTGEKKRTILKPPQVAREGTRKTIFTNFQELCRLMNRSHEHVIQFMLVELGTCGSLDGSMRLVVKGRFLPKAFENVLRRYMIEYVLCNSCKTPDTKLDRDQSTRLLYMKCNQCGSSRSVSTVKSGFQARVTSRKADRAAGS